MTIPDHIKDLVALALQDRVLTFKERQTIVNAAVKMDVEDEIINAYIDEALNIRLKSYTEEELGSCPDCGHGVPLISNECPYCGRWLEHIDEQQIVPPQYRITDKAANIIRDENTCTAEEKKKNCPKCGAPYPLISNICPYCQYILHERPDSDLNIQNLIANIKESISTLKDSILPFVISMDNSDRSRKKMSFGEIVTTRTPLWFFYYGAALLIFSFRYYNLFFIIFSGLFLLFAMIMVITEPKTLSVIQEADNKFYKAHNNYEKYSRQIDTLYGDSREAKKLLADYAEIIDVYKKARLKHRNKLAALYVVLLLIPVAIYFILPTDAQQYASESDKHPDIYQMADFSKTLNYTPQQDRAENVFFTPDTTAELKFDVMSKDIVVIRGWSDVKYQMRIAGVNLLPTGQSTRTPDTCTLQAALLSKNGDIVGKEFSPFDIIVSNKDDNYQTLIANGRGHILVDFVSKEATSSAQRLKEIADSTYYFTIFLKNSAL